MNALPIKTPTPQEIIDDLVAEFGIKKVVLATVARLFKRTRPPDLAVEKQPGVDGLSDRMRADIGLPPQDHAQQFKIDLITMGHMKF
ncbi:MAG: hypothetical protein ABJO29_10285 [Yoonia sp.]|uniref:hypothetical protein n=1 Tax=Rhodobacterales TaxID=204455 RepID=UPI001FF30A7C|nr:hypothetical protein [Loktanella sp. F6476L]MCK0122279.1 hypothetical protein [Loktanella sp. F6476L]UWQ99965.1 hypothetical protein K3729_04055 [Rhodobacteraceae bacterium S2214]